MLLKTINKNIVIFRLLSATTESQNSNQFKKWARILELDGFNFDENSLRMAYIRCVKKYHPDHNKNSGFNDDHRQHEMFVQIEEAYTKLKEYLRNKETKLTENEDNDKHTSESNQSTINVKEKVAQHRHYLTNDGTTGRNVFERSKQAANMRINKAINNVGDFRTNKFASESELGKTTELTEISLLMKFKTRQGYERLIEDYISEYMAKGYFDNLKGSGKPIKWRPEIPYMDSTTYKMNEILINNGYVPEWVSLEKEIRQEINSLREQLAGLLSNGKLNKPDDASKAMKDAIKKLNFKIDKYNSLVPILTKQKIHFVLSDEISRISKAKLQS